MKTSEDLKTLKALPSFKIWGEGFARFDDVKIYKGKFVVTKDKKFIAKLVPKSEYDQVMLFHNFMLEELGVKESESQEVRKIAVGGGKIEIELIDDYVECRLWSKSTTYGGYEPTDIDLAGVESAIQKTFNLGLMPILVISDFQN